MAAIGLNADAKSLLSDSGIKARAAAFIGFIAAVAVFLAGCQLLGI